ncbi:37S ribosomal protein S22 [Dipsacomyces acuminosporus]|nr:37S ribosomal protein S22 [Dipsacomyces acuminosporus]
MPELLLSCTPSKPEYLQDKDKKLLRHDYLRIADSLRSTGQTTPKGKGRGRAAMEYRREEKLKEEEEDDEELSYRDLGIPTPLPGERVEISIRGVRPPPQSLANPGTPLKPHTLEYGKRESTAYLASYAPATYGVIFNILTELADRLPGFKPQSILDFGSGPAPVLWASQEVWPKFESYQGVDISEDVLQCAESLIADSTIPEDKRARNINFVRYLAPSTNGTSGKSDLVVSTFTLSELPSDDVRKTTVETLWNHTKDILVLVDRGTPDAARMIAEAREQLLELGAKEDSGIHTLAPIPNDLPDPTKDSMSWIHFSQRVQRPNYTMLTKHAKSNLEDLKYSYVIMRRGSRPTVSEPFAPSSSEPVALDVAQQNPEKYLPNGMERKSKERLSLESCSWPRVILPPIKRKGHVLIDVCTVEGKVERWTFTKSHSKQAYRDARKANWGDLFPHTPKSTTVRPGFEPRVKMDPEEKKKAKKNKNKKAYRTTSILDSGE